MKIPPVEAELFMRISRHGEDKSLFVILRTRLKITFYYCYWRLAVTKFIKTSPVFKVGRQDSIQRTGIPEQTSNIWLLQEASKSTRRGMHKEATYLRHTEYEIIRKLQM